MKKIFVIVLFVILYIGQVGAINYYDEVKEKLTVLEQDSLALVALYDDTNGDNWTNKTNWLTGNVADWYGLTTSGDRVIEIALDSNNLIGTIPLEIGNLTGLQILKLDHNQLSGSIPPEIGNLTNLTELTLWENQLTGMIPSEISNLTSLTILDLDVNQLSGSIPSEIGNLVNLEEFWLSNNQLTGSIPSSIGNLTNLMVLSIWENQLTGIIPTEIGNLSALTNLSLSDNQLSGSIPSEIGNLTNLAYLHLGSNQLSGSIPTEIGNLTNLSFLYLGHNQFTGSIPSSIGNLSKLDLLSLTDNQLTNSIPIEISSLDSLKTLSLGENQLSGSIPAGLQNLSNLTKLYLWGNQLTGSIPPEIGNLVNLTNLQLSSNQLTGTIPPEFGNLVNLDILYLWENQLTGSIPTEIGNLSNLTKLSLSDNQLTGSIPTEIGNLTNLTYLRLYSNPLSGSIPISIGNLTNLTYLSLGYNQLTGSIPPEIGNLINLETLYLGYNQLSGSIPPEIGNLTNLTYLHLASNQLTGSIPSVIWNLTNLTYLNFHTNQLTGSIPTEIENLNNLTSLWLYENLLSGFIPIEIVNLTNLQRLYLYDNQFTDLPDLSSLIAMEYLQIQDNKLTFKDIEPNIGVANTSYTYSPQDSVGKIIDTTAYVGTDFTLSVSTGGNNSQYQWKKNGANIGSISADSTYTISPVAFSDTGAYTCEIINTVATDLTLYSHPINVFVDPPLQKDSLALVDLYNSTDGTNWTNDANWLTGNVSTWFGITVSGDRVTEISFDHNNLNGTIPTSIGNLDSLQILNLPDNQLSGTIPAEIYNLENLQHLNLNMNQLIGEISPEIGNLTNLYELYLWSNQLSGSIPTEICNLPNLTFLDLNSNQLTGEIPSETGNLLNLNSLIFSNNQLTGSIPNTIGNLINLTDLNVEWNQLTGEIPPEIGNLTNLHDLWLNDNQLSGSIPPEIDNLSNLTSLWLRCNQLTGSIPTEIGNLLNLTSLTIDDNLLSGLIPQEIYNLTNLTCLRLSGNQLLEGSIPAEINNLTNLTELWLFGNKFTDLPNLTPLDTLKELLIENNRFTFKDIEPNIGVPSTIFTYSPQDSIGETIDTTAYIGTDFTLSISTGGASSQYQWKKDGANIGSISADSTFTINAVAFSDSGTYSCEITNTVATELTLYSRPTNVMVDYTPFYKDSLALVALYDSTNGTNWTNNTNWLTGHVSSWFGITVFNGRVTEINLYDNNLTGTISAEIGNLTNLENLVLSYNQLSCPIPTEIGNLTNLTGLDLNSNQLTSSIPIEIGNLINLNYLHLYCNNLSGSIPAEIGSLTSLQNLHLRENQLIGSIPIEIGNLTNLTFLGLEDNQLSGSIPIEIGNLINLTQLQLNNNNLSSSIPSEISNLINLTNLWLQMNQLSGTVPIEIWNLSSMDNLQLFHNQLSGTIPPEIGNMSNLVFLNLHDNQFTGLANLSLLGSLDELTIENNKFTFEDIEPNIGVPSTTFTYSPQDSVGMPQDTTVSPCSSFTISVSVGGSSNKYQWKKDGTTLMDADSSAYIMSFISPSDSGTYTCEITNTIATELTLYSRPINVTVGPVLNITSEYSDTICLNSNKGYIDISVSGGTPPYFYAWSNGSTNEDVYDLEADEYSVTVSDYYNCIEIETITIASTSPCSTGEICMVTVDNSNMNLIIWEKTQDEGIALYKIYRETINDGVYEQIGTVPYEDLSVFVDSTSNPGQSSYKYKLSIIDTCGIVSEKSYYHGTMLLQVSVGTGANNLDWNNYEYEEGDFNFSKFYIYRGSSQDNLQKIDSLEANYITYIDSDPPDGLLYYQVAGVKPDACFPTTKKKSISDENYTLSFTNIFNYGVTGLDDINYSNKIKIYPNPFTNKTTIEFPNPKFDSYKLIITNMSGTTVKIIKNIKTGKVELERGTLQEGLYLIELRGDKIYKGKFIIN